MKWTYIRSPSISSGFKGCASHECRHWIRRPLGFPRRLIFSSPTSLKQFAYFKCDLASFNARLTDFVSNQIIILEVNVCISYKFRPGKSLHLNTLLFSKNLDFIFILVRNAQPEQTYFCLEMFISITNVLYTHQTFLQLKVTLNKLFF